MYDLIVIGGGPAGLAAAYAAWNKGLKHNASVARERHSALLQRDHAPRHAQLSPLGDEEAQRVPNCKGGVTAYVVRQQVGVLCLGWFSGQYGWSPNDVAECDAQSLVS